LVVAATIGVDIMAADSGQRISSGSVQVLLLAAILGDRPISLQQMIGYEL
jgi:hypothetical protein